MRNISHYVVISSIFLLIGVIASTPFSFAESIESPKKQMEKGVLSKDVVCNSGLVLILKASDNSAACVKQSTSIRLLQQGWGIMVPKVSPQETTPQNQSQTKPPLIPTPTSKFNLAFLASSNSANIQLFEDNLKPGDYLIVSTSLADDSKAASVLQQAADIKSKVKPGVNVITLVWYASINDIESKTSKLPKGIDYIAYDFEPWDKTPEYTTDQQETTFLLDRALKVTHDNGFKLMFTPTYGTIKNGQIVMKDWDWSQIAQHTDSLVIQFQGYFKLSNGATEGNNMKNIIKDISDKSPNTLTFVQLALTPVGGTPDENIGAINDLHGGNINKFLIYYGGPQSTDDLRDLLTKIQH